MPRYLRTGTLADCIVVCDDKTLKAHKAFLSRVPRFSPQALETQNRFCFSGFEIYEVMWLLEWVYHHEPSKHLLSNEKERENKRRGPLLKGSSSSVPLTASSKPDQRLDIKALSATHPTKAHLDTYIRLAQIARFYQVQDLEKAATAALQARCADMMKTSPEQVAARGLVAPLLAPIRQAFRDERKPSTPDEVKWAMCRLAQKYKGPLHSSYAFCKALLVELDPAFGVRCVVEGCENCAWVASAARVASAE